MKLFNQIVTHGHEKVLFCSDRESGLRAIVAIHSTRRGPALGATRLWPYPDEDAALADVLRLSRGMTLKAACAGLDVGGGKAVIIARPEDKSDGLFRAYGRFVESLAGSFVTGTDVNTTIADMEIVRRETRHVLNKPSASGGAGDTGHITALGVLCGMRAAVEQRLGRDLAGVRVAVQGLGKVGENLCRLLAAAGAELHVADVRPEVAARVARTCAARVVAPDDLFGLEVDVVAPCALGAILNEATIPRLRCAVVAGGANNQLADETRDGLALHRRGITYVPDFVLNAGGLISVVDELVGGGRAGVLAQVHAIHATVAEILDEAARRDLSPVVAAVTIAESRIRATRAAA